MNTPDNITANKINELHDSLISQLKRTIETAIEIGQLLTEKKAELKHGEFGSWIKDNLVFTDRTARRYMLIFVNKEKVLQTGSITEAYKMLGEGKNDTVSYLDKTDTVSDLDDLIEIKMKRIRIDEKMKERQSIKRINDAKIEYMKNHPDSISPGKMKLYNIAGYKCKTEITGQLQCRPGPLLPIISYKIVDERFLNADEIQQKDIIRQVGEFGFHHGWDKWGLEIEL